MHRWLLLAALGATGCNAVFGLGPTTLFDGAVDDDGPRLFVPPDGSMQCPPPPDFETWTYTPKTLAGVTTEIVHPTFLADDRAAFASGGSLYESSLAGPARRLDELELDLIDMTWPSAAPNADILWFVRVSEMAGVPQPDVGNYYASRAADVWTPHRAELGISGYQLEIGSVGFFGGTARMVVGVTPTGMDRMRLVELTSTDGLTWTQLDTFPFSTGDVAEFDPSLSADGCLVFYTRSGMVQVARRESDGRFSAPQALVAATGGTFATSATLAPNRTRLWLKRGMTLVEGVP